jgi:thiosulfate/3-mercaptopyruvate sulfurtransferase
MRDAFLADTGWLEENLGDPSLRVLDCTVYLRPRPEGGMTIESGREHWAQGHIPGAAFADLKEELSDTNQKLRFMMPSDEQFAEAMSSYGIGEDTQVVLYDANMSMWAARVWWMLRAFGFDNARVLDGGWKKWKLEGRSISTEPSSYPRGSFVARPRPSLIATKDDVQAAISDGATCVVNALAEDQHTGKVNAYGRPGHIPGSTNVPAMRIIDPETGAYLPLDELRKQFDVAGATSAGRVITYCGGGIAASSDAFVLTMLGHENVAVYDASLSEWAADPSLPLDV